ncbi:MAG: MATE family efflux transporter [Pseudomonadota bacterium]
MAQLIASAPSWRSDLGTIVAIGWPLIINNLSSIAVATGDTLMAADLGATHLAAVAIGSGVWIAIFLFGLGTIMALSPTVAQHFGAGKLDEIAHDTRQGFWLAFVVSALAIVIMRSVEPLLHWLGIEAAVVILAQGYLDALSFGVIGAYFYHTLKQMCEGVGETVPIMSVMCAALPINVGLNYGFMYGHLGLEPLGAIGAGLGTAISFWLMFLGLAGVSVFHKKLNTYEIWGALERPDLTAIGRLVSLGLPIGLSLCLQSGLFTAAALIMGVISTVAVAAHQLVLNYSSLVFMVPLGFGMALTVCVGQAVGRGDAAGAARIGRRGFVLCGFLSSISGLTTFLLAEPIARFYTDDAVVVATAVSIFKVAAFLQVADGVQVAATFALRGLKDTRIPLLINAVCYWGVGFTVMLFFGLHLEAGPVAIWVGLSMALACAGTALISRFVLKAEDIAGGAQVTSIVKEQFS